MALRSAGRDRIAYITNDDLNAAISLDLNRYGARIRAPNTIALRDSSMNFRKCQTHVPVCNPARAAFICGKSAYNTGVYNNTTPWYGAFPLQETLPYLMKQAGYRNAMIGKITHGGPLAGPTGNAIWHQAPLDICEFVTGASPEPGETRDRAVSREAISYIRGTIETSPLDRFFLMIGFNDHHSPYGINPDGTPSVYRSLFPLEDIVIPEWDGDPRSPCYDPANNGFANTSEAEMKYLIQGYLADIYATDKELGRVLNYLEPLDFTIIFTSDHGLCFGEHRELGKFNLWNTACTVPLYIRYPGSPIMTIDDAVSSLDVTDTIRHHTGFLRPSWFDGRTLIPYATTVGYSRDNGALIVRDGDVSLCLNDYRINRYRKCSASGDEYTYELYYHPNDPMEETNLALDGTLQSLLDEMIALLEARIEELSP